MVLVVGACGGEGEPSLDSGHRDASVDGSTDGSTAADSSADASSDAGPDGAPLPDGAAPEDSSIPTTDSGADGGDAGPAPSCRPERVTPIIIAGGPFAVGVLCDDVFVCALDAGDAAAITAAAPEFVCAAEAGAAGRCTAYTCTYRDPGGPSVVDEGEYQAICAVTVLEPPRPIYCAVYP